ncbi:MAG TPA: PBP1A family penicillin-binding protein [Leptolyngbyaceae cyanobacterium M65_K2018_010]|nr:PBP1A family penicillin-binding protein [Leptolyngbyaceae cyanobacterium M65_K2018_010]
MTQFWLTWLFPHADAKPGASPTNFASTAPSRHPPHRRQRSPKARPAATSRPRLTPPSGQQLVLPLILLVGALLAGGGTRAYRIVQATQASLPEAEEALTYERDGTVTMVSADGVILQKLGPASRETTAYANIPDHLVQAFIASEDQRFYDHNGVDYRGIIRALWANLRQREVVEGASTITQQLARIVYLNQERSFQRKAREILLAHKLEQDLDKQQIMERYLNLVYLGSGAYGVADAAWIYFGKTLDQLTVAESALIAGMAPAPSRYSPVVNQEAARSQRNRVIRRMLATGAITAAEAEAAISSSVEVNPKQPKFLYSEFPYFTIYIQKQLEQLLPPDQLEAGGLTVETSLNVSWQRKAEQTVDQAIERYSGWQGVEQVALVAVDPRNGEIKAMVGGNDFNASQFNRATQAQRQPGSTFKTFVYATAIAAGFSPYKEYMDARYVVDGYEPKNYGETYSGNVDLLRALRNSINIVAVKLLVDVGFDPVIEVAKRMGIQSPLLPAYSLALGTSEVNLLELTSAYGTLANRGRHVPVHGIRRVLNSQGEVIYETPKESVQAIDEDTAAIMTWMLRSVVEGGTGSNASLGRPVAGKTGTSEKNRDLWFIGYIPQLATGVWMGNDDSSPSRGASTTAAAIWRMFMSQLTDEIPVEQFPALPRLGGRKGTLEAKPIKPGRVTAEQAPSSPARAERESRGTTEQRGRDPEPEPTGITPAASTGSTPAPPSGGETGTPAAPAPVITSDPPTGTSPEPVVAPAPAPPAANPAPVPAPAPAPPPIVAPPPPLGGPSPSGEASE